VTLNRRKKSTLGEVVFLKVSEEKINPEWGRGRTFMCMKKKKKKGTRDGHLPYWGRGKKKKKKEDAKNIPLGTFLIPEE